MCVGVCEEAQSDSFLLYILLSMLKGKITPVRVSVFVCLKLCVAGQSGADAAAEET